MMQQQDVDPRLLARMRWMSLELKADASFQQMMAALREIGAALIEQKYRANQPRAPKGTAEGGQWIADAGSARQQRLHNESVLVAQSGYSMGNLVAQYPLTDKIMCIYQFDFGLVGVPGGIFGCQVRVPSASVAHGYRLNDN